MRPWMILIGAAALGLGTGCTHTALERRTVKQASTLTDLQYKQVLDNLAMFSCNPEALPWHVKLKGGTVQIADQGSGGFAADITTVAGGDTRLMPAVGAQRGVLNQWDVEPAVDSDELEHLGLVYRKAVNPTDPELWNQTHDAICGLSARFSLLPRDETIRRIIWKHEGGAYPLKDQLPDPEKIKIKDYPGAKRVVEIVIALEAQEEDLDNAQRKADEKDKQKHKDQAAFKRHQTTVLKGLLMKEPSEEQIAKWKREVQGQENKRPPPPKVAVGQQRKDARPLDETSDTMPLILTAIHAACPAGYLPSTDVIWDTERNPGLIDQAEDKIRKFEDLLTADHFQVPWLGVGCKKDVPRCVCYVGHYRSCGRDCYVWVTPGNLRFLREYTLAVLTVAPVQAQDVLGGRGAAFSPSLR